MDKIGFWLFLLVFFWAYSGFFSCKIGIVYETSPDATGLQWITPKATAGKELPLVFSQFQPTHARSVIPCQDTPGVKAPYTATVSFFFAILSLKSIFFYLVYQSGFVEKKISYNFLFFGHSLL